MLPLSKVVQKSSQVVTRLMNSNPESVQRDRQAINCKKVEICTEKGKHEKNTTTVADLHKSYERHKRAKISFFFTNIARLTVCFINNVDRLFAYGQCPAFVSSNQYLRSNRWGRSRILESMFYSQPALCAECEFLNIWFFSITVRRCWWKIPRGLAKWPIIDLFAFSSEPFVERLLIQINWLNAFKSCACLYWTDAGVGQQNFGTNHNIAASLNSVKRKIIINNT